MKYWDIFKGVCRLAAALACVMLSFVLLFCEADSFFWFIMSKVAGVILFVIGYRLSPIYDHDHEHDND